MTQEIMEMDIGMKRSCKQEHGSVESTRILKGVRMTVRSKSKRNVTGVVSQDILRQSVPKTRTARGVAVLQLNCLELETTQRL